MPTENLISQTETHLQAVAEFSETEKLLQMARMNGYNAALLDASRLVSNHAEAIAILKLSKYP
jgi:hypothetical protein